jgi:hypothetical protein
VWVVVERIGKIVAVVATCLGRPPREALVDGLDEATTILKFARRAQRLMSAEKD